MNEHFFSVIVPCYNCCGFIKKTLISLENQSFKDFEVLIIDDCSSDSTIEEIEDYKHNTSLDIKLYKNRENKGPGSSRNIAVRKAKGRFILFLDSDDSYNRDLMKILYKEIERTNSDALIWGLNYSIKNKLTPLQSNLFFITSENKQEIIANASGSLCLLCTKSILWDSIKLPDIYNAEDIAVIPLLLKKAKNITIIKKHLYNYTVHPKSLSAHVNENVYHNFIKSFNYTRSNFLKDNSLFMEELEFHGIKTVLYGALLNALKAKVRKKQISHTIDIFNKDFPFWKKNKYLKGYSYHKRIFLFFIEYKFFILLKLYAKVHSIYFRV